MSIRSLSNCVRILGADNSKVFSFDVNDRDSWQNRFADYRNQEIEHQSGNQRVEDFENPRAVEAAFYNTWRTMEDWAVIAINASVKPPMRIVAIPKDERNPSAPKKYQLTIDASVLAQQEADPTI